MGFGGQIPIKIDGIQFFNLVNGDVVTFKHFLQLGEKIHARTILELEIELEN